ncbi:hypothetical protein NDU88_004243 [Pleurodeles waltl]|uniref:Uncharacterized protein n=1 Tax=Pleurodeles waltl TaxID=8319 RepID=A0AAV7W968_PLEWA|nr:hypothetical protein NDU88_004243 [Pleurodeles waltl]
MAALLDLTGTPEPKLNAVRPEVMLLRTDLKTLSDRVTVADSNDTTLQSTSKRLKGQVQYLTKQTNMVTTKLEEQERRAHRNNIMVMEVPEGAEGLSADLFLGDFILKTLKPKCLSNFFTERAHRKPLAPPHPEDYCTIITRIFNYQDKDAFLEVTGTSGDLHYEKAVVRLFPDFPLQVQRQHCSFDEVTKALQTRELKYMMLYLAQPQVVARGKSWNFTSPEEVWDRLEGWHHVRLQHPGWPR